MRWLDCETYSCSLSHHPRFSLAFNATSGGPFTLSLRSAGAPSVVARNAMVGDVYLCSGQSNMVFPVGPGNGYPVEDGGQSIANATAEILAAHHPDMRMWAVPTGAPEPASSQPVPLTVQLS